MNIEEEFIARCQKFRLHFKLSENDIDTLLSDKNLKYTGLELGTKTLTLKLAEAYPMIYGIDYCHFKLSHVPLPDFDDLPQTTQNYINSRPKGAGGTVGLKGSKNMASYVILAIKDYQIGRKFLNIEILKTLPPPLNEQKTIAWTTGLLSGHVKNTKKHQNYIDEEGAVKRMAIYTIVKQVSQETLDQALKNIEKK